MTEEQIGRLRDRAKAMLDRRKSILALSRDIGINTATLWRFMNGNNMRWDTYESIRRAMVGKR